MNSKLGVSLLLTLFTAVLSAAQAWVLRGAPPRVVRYAVAWIVCTGLIAYGGQYFLWEGKSDPTGRGMLAMQISAGIITAVAFLVGGLVSRKKPPGETWRETAGGLVGVHFSVALAGSAIALVVVILVTLANANW